MGGHFHSDGAIIIILHTHQRDMVIAGIVPVSDHIETIQRRIGREQCHTSRSVLYAQVKYSLTLVAIIYVDHIRYSVKYFFRLGLGGDQWVVEIQHLAVDRQTIWCKNILIPIVATDPQVGFVRLCQ